MTDIVDRAKQALSTPCECPDCSRPVDCPWRVHDNREQLAELVPELVAEIERLRAALNADTEIHRIRYLGEQDQISPQQWAQAELHHSRQEQP